MRDDEQPVCPNCGWPLHIGQHGPHPEDAPREPTHPLPEDLAHRFVNGTIFNDAEVVAEGEHGDIYRGFIREEPNIGIQAAKLRIDFQKSSSSNADTPKQVRFEYVQPDKVDSESDVLVAEMHIAPWGKNKFVLQHRYVQPEFQGKLGLGTKLLQQVESWLAQVASEKKEDVILEVDTGQKGVISWVEKNGFSVDPDQVKELQEVVDHPDRYALEDVPDVDGLTKPEFIFRNDTPGRTVIDAVRFTFSKKISG
ncbi:MAG: GNAT family N-acetyltransferase [Patescibacteria group bacterium]|jgi:ribosomal protein S18 acetylase RimI-like enzyme